MSTTFYSAEAITFEGLMRTPGPIVEATTHERIY